MKKLNRNELEALALKVEASSEYLRLILSGHKQASEALAAKIHHATNGEIAFSYLRPDIAARLKGIFHN